MKRLRPARRPAVASPKPRRASLASRAAALFCGRADQERQVSWRHSAGPRLSAKGGTGNVRETRFSRTPGSGTDRERKTPPRPIRGYAPACSMPCRHRARRSPGYVRALVWCKACRHHRADADLPPWSRPGAASLWSVVVVIRQVSWCPKGR
jgi:hypothetical protein